MSRTVTAFFDTRADAEAAKERLAESSVAAEHVQIHDKSSEGYDEASSSSKKSPGMWASIKHAFLPDEDRHTYEEGVRRGGIVLTADVDEANVDDAVRILDEAKTVDIDQRSQEWRTQGWQADAPKASATQGEQVIPIVEEELVVGKREVDRGGVRVRSYVTETPVHEQIRLRNERIEVQRRTVDRPLSAGDDAFQERTIDMSATGEEAVVGKTARVVEEVAVFKTDDEHVEDVEDTVRRTDVEVDRGASQSDQGGEHRGA
jgi:uncharacterized protein (TIGR02271 family)